MTAPDLPGFDPADPSTWHPMNGVVVDALHTVAPMLGIPPGTNLAPAAEHIARTLFQPTNSVGHITMSGDDMDDIGPGSGWQEARNNAITEWAGTLPDVTAVHPSAPEEPR